MMKTICTDEALRWTHEGKTYVLVFDKDQDPMNPREEQENAEHMICWSKRYNLGDQHDYEEPFDFLSTLAEQLQVMPADATFSKLYEALKPVACLLPLWLYSHSGITICCGTPHYPYTDRWDSCQVGFIYITKQEMMDLNPALNDNTWYQEADRLLHAATEIYDQYLTGDVYGYTLYRCADNPRKGMDDIDSCWNFYGSDLETNGILENVGFGLMDAIHNDTCEVIDRPSEEDIMGEPPMTLRAFENALKEHPSLTIMADTNGLFLISQPGREPCHSESLEDAIQTLTEGES